MPLPYVCVDTDSLGSADMGRAESNSSEEEVEECLAFFFLLSSSLFMLSKRVGRNHNAILLSATLKGDSANASLVIIILGVIIIAREASSELDVGWARARPVDGGHVGGDVPVGHTSLAGGDTISTRVGGVVDVDFLVRPVAEADVGSRGSTCSEACSRDTEHEVHNRVKVEQEDGGCESIADKGGDEEDDSVLEEEFPERRATRSQEETDGGDDQDGQIDKHGVEVEQVQRQVVVGRTSR